MCFDIFSTEANGQARSENPDSFPKRNKIPNQKLLNTNKKKTTQNQLSDFIRH